MTDRVFITIDSKYQRDQFDDWLAGGKVEYKGRIYYWSAQDSNYGFGWEVDTIDEEDWDSLDESGFNELLKVIKKSLCGHKTEYVTAVPLSENCNPAS